MISLSQLADNRKHELGTVMKITVWCAARGGMRSVVEAYGRDGFLDRNGVHLIASYTDGSFLKRQIVLVKALLSFFWCLCTKRVTLVHIHAAMRGSFWRKGLFSSLARLFGIPVVLHLHGSEMKPFYNSLSPFFQKLVRRHLEKATRVIVLSESWRSFVASIAPAARITVVPNYVTIPDLPAPSDRKPQDILFLGLIGPRKGTFDLIHAFATIAPQYPDARLIIGGNGQVEEARQLVQQLGMETRINLAGWVGPEEKKVLLDSSGIYVLPSYNEGLPMSVLEAMAAGLAVVTTKVGGIPELITDKVDGLLIEAGDRVALADAMASILGDNENRLRLAQGGRERVKSHYSDEVMLPVLDRIYAECERH